MEKFYITTPIYYVNGDPHIGHAYTDVFADVLARYQRSLGKNVFFLTGTDEHGAKIMQSAERAGIPVEKFVESQSEKFKTLAAKLQISADDFIRTTDREKHWPGALALWEALRKAGDIYLAKYQGLYCLGHEAFITEKDLVDGKCEEHNAVPERIEEENYFFRLSEYADRIRAHIVSNRMHILPESRKNEVIAMIDAGVSDISFSRPSKDVPWGIPIPEDETQTMYVWCDALSNYLSALGYGREEGDGRFMFFWPADVHVIGKDILRFHALIWPGMLLAAGLPLPKQLAVHGYILSGGKKMSKTIGNVIEPIGVIEEHGTDAFRNFVMTEIPTFEDGDFTRDRFLSVYNAKFSNTLGNIVSRISTMIEKYADGALKRPSPDDLQHVRIKRYVPQLATHEVVEVKGEDAEFYVLNINDPEYHRAMQELRIGDAARIGWSLLSTCDRYIQEYEPYKLFSTSPDRARAVVWNASILLLSAVRMLSPIIPESAASIFERFGTSPDAPVREWTILRARHGAPLFPRRNDESKKA